MSALDDRLFLGVDVGGSSVKAVLTDDAFDVLTHVRLPTDASDADALIMSAATAVDRVLEDVIDRKTVAGIGIGVPGQVDPATGVVRMAMNLNIGDEGVPIGTSIADRFGLDTTVENDVRAAAVGAFGAFHPRTPDLHTLVYLSIGTGVAAGVVIDGELFRGRDGLAGEVGHVVVDEDGPPCACGLRGCLEAMVGGPALRQMWPSADGKHAQDLYRAAAAGDATAAAAAHRLTVRLTETVQWLAIAYGADLLVMGGGVGSLGEPLLSSIRGRLSAFADRSELAGRMVPPERVVAMPTGHATGAIGAAVLARQRLGDGRAGSKGGEGARTAATGSDGGGST
jgi:glucokinase